MPLATRVIAGVTVPDTPLITSALEFARAHSTPYAFNHIKRSWIFGVIIASKKPEFSSIDPEVVAVASLLHDVGWDPTGVLVSKDKRFEVDGANAAREFLRKEALGWDDRKVQLVWDAIALHTIGSVVFFKEPEVVAAAYGIWADFQGPDRVPDGMLTWAEYGAVVKELPRLGLMEGLKSVMCGLCRDKPETTYDNVVADWGEKFVEGYSKKGKTSADMLLSGNLDELTEEDIRARQSSK